MKPLRILVTGAAGAIGRATSEALRAAGHRVAGLDVAPAPGLVQADLRDDVQVRRAVAQAAEALGGLDVLVNNAGTAVLEDTGTAPGEATRAVLDTNFLGAWRVTTAALPHLLERRGRVVNVASILAFLNLPFLAGYCASKRALAALSDVLRAEYAGSLSVVTVYPGYVKTPLHAAGSRVGLTMEGLVPEEPLDRVAATIARACTGPARRDVAVSMSGVAAMWVGRTLPAALDLLAARRIRRLAREGGLDGAALARPMARRLTGAGA